MKKRTLLFRNLIYYRRVNLVVILGMITAVMVIVGSLAVGDSVKNSLLNLIQLHLGKTDSAIISRDSMFEATLAERIAKFAKTDTAPLLLLNGLATDPQGKYRINQVNVIGIDQSFREFALDKTNTPLPDKTNAVINKTTAERLELKPGDEFILRMGKPTLLPADVNLLSEKDHIISLRLTVKAIAGGNFPGNFSFQNSQLASANIFLPLQWLGEKTEQAGKANVILAQEQKKINLNSALSQAWNLADAGLEITKHPNGVIDIKSEKVFIPQEIRRKINKIPGAHEVFTYFVNSIGLENKAGKIIRSTPYSFVTGIQDDLGLGLKDKIGDDEIVLNQWLADDLKAKIGDKIQLKYFYPAKMHRLITKKKTFTIKAIIPIYDRATDKSLMPDFPGLSDSEKCAEWDSSIPINMDKIRDKDEEYWKKYKGTPKAFISNITARLIWRYLYWDITLIRFIPQKGVNPLQALRDSLKPEDLGFTFLPVRKKAIASINRGTGGNFSYLFMSLSFFLLFSAFMLTVLLFMLGVESRQNEFAILESIGFTSCEIRSLFMKEGLILACIGAIIGAPLGLIFNQAILYCLDSVWKGAIGATAISSSVNPWTPFMGGIIGIIIAWTTLRIALGKYTKNLQQANEEKTIILKIPPRIKIYLLVSILLCIIGISLIIIGLLSDNPGTNPAIFFSCGALLILSDWLCWRFCLEWIKKHNILAKKPTPLRLALKNTTYKPMRSMAAVILLSCGIFLTIAVAINKRTTPNPLEKSSGTGGYTFFIKTSIPVTYDMNTAEGKKKMGLNKELFEDIQFVNLRLHEGDNASCLNLNRAKQPAILGVDFEKFANPERFTFTGTANGISKEQAWNELSSKKQVLFEFFNGVADQEVIMWSMGKMIGSDLEIPDESGEKQVIKLNGALASSIFQGYVLVPHLQFMMMFPSIGGARVILVEVPQGKKKKVKEALATALMDYGAEITTCSSRLDEFYRVANTYLSIFLILGGLGVLVGTAGFGAIVLRNITERRFELAIMNATGYSKELIRKIVTLEHALLIFAGGLSGGITAFVAVIPALFNASASPPPYALVSILFLLILACGIISVYIAACFTTRSSTLSALRKE